MYALSADTYMIRQKETRRTTLHRERHSKTFPKAGLVRHAESERNILKRSAETPAPQKKEEARPKSMLPPFIYPDNVL